MRINHNISAMITQGSLSSANNSMAGNLEKLSTGLRVNRASDDAAGLSVSEKMRTQIRGMGKAKQNAQDGIALLQIAEGAAGTVTDLLQRQRELSVQASNDTLTSTERGYIDQEFQALTIEVDRITRATQYNGLTLLDGVESTTKELSSFGIEGAGGPQTLHIGANELRNTDEIAVTYDAISAGALGLTGTAGPLAAVTNQAAAVAAISTLDTAIDTVNKVRSDMGAFMNRLDYTVTNLENQTYNTQDAESRIRDVDFATESTEYTRSQILTQSATSMLAQANSVPQSALSLIG